MGSGVKTKHASYAVQPAPPETSSASTDDLATELVATVEAEEALWAQIDNAEVWQAYHVPAESAIEFVKAGIHEPAVGTDWLGAGIAGGEAAVWISNDIVTPGDAQAWASYGISPEQAGEAISHHHTIADVIVQGAKKFEPATANEDEDEDEETDGLDEEPVYEVDDVAPISTLAEAGEVPEVAWEEAVTPIPEQIPVGDPRGVALLIGGADLEDSSATIMAYAPTAPSGAVHEVLFCKLNEEAEEKLLETLAPAGDKMVQVEKQIPAMGRLELDTQQQIYEKLVLAAKSVNHHLKEGDGASANTIEKLAAAKAALSQAAGSGDPKIAAMAAHYQPLLDAYEERAAPSFSVPYTEGGKGPAVTPFEAEYMKTEVVWEPDQSDGPKGQALLASLSRTASRVSPNIVDGESRWDGHSRANGQGKEYVITLPDGYTAVYHPYSYLGQNLASDDYSLRGRLELHAPPGEGHAKDLVNALGSLNIVNRPMNGAEAEWTYLSRNIDALGLKNNPQIKQAMVSARALEGPVQQTLILEHAEEAAALYAADDMDGVQRLVDRVTLEAEAAALPYQVRILRRAVAKALDIPSAKELVEHPAYRPTPRKAAGRMVFDRFDVARDEKALKSAFGSRHLVHHVTGGSKSGGSILAIFKSGGILASQERRRMMGAASGVGMSEGADKATGGAGSAFVRVKGGSSSAPGCIYWDNPLQLLRRTDWYGYNGDHFGSVNAASHYSVAGQTKSPKQVAGFSSGSNEIMFNDGIDLIGDDAPSKVVCTSAAERDAVRKLLAERGITHLGTRPVAEVIVAP